MCYFAVIPPKKTEVVEVLASAFVAALSEKLEAQNLSKPLAVEDVIDCTATTSLFNLSTTNSTVERNTQIEGKEKRKRILRKSKSSATEIKQIVQLTSMPEILNLSEYRDPISSFKPNGNYDSAYSLYALANRVPSVSPFFQENGHSLADLWGGLVYGAASETIDSTSITLSEAHRKFILSKKSGRAGFPDDWHLVETKPYNWYDLLLEEHMITLDIDLQNNIYSSKDTQFLTIDGMQSLSWMVLNKKGKWSSKPIQRGTKIQKLQVKVLKVDFNRSWLVNEVFERTWKINGLKRGYYSSGNLKGNTGVLPLIVGSMLVSTGTIMHGEISKKDKEVLEGASAVALGGFVLEQNEKSQQEFSLPKTACVVGYISRLVPLAPALDG